MAQIIWSEPALQELDEIADYISLDNLKAAKKLVRKCFDRVGDLKRHPRLGKGVQELDRSMYRELVEPPCRLFYRIEEEKETIYIIHAVRSKQLLHLDILKSR
jgi:plasmid stabilization system protein ParE